VNQDVNVVNRVVVTGAGVISPIGHTADAYCAALKQGQPGIGPITIPYAEEVNQKAVAEVKDYDPAKYLDDRQIAMMDRVSQFAVITAREAIAQAGIDFANGLSERTATIVGIGVGGQSTHDDQFRRLYKQGTPRVHPLTIPKLMANAPASQVSMDRGLRGPAFAVASACASATHAIGIAFHMVRSGAVSCAVTGGAEACITVGTVKGWEAMRVMAPDTCRPFSKDRKGMVLGEGAAAVVLEPLEAAQARGATILAELVGFGMSADAKELTSPDQNGMMRAIEGALADARLGPGDIQYVNAHGTGTTANDVAETKAIRQAFGAHAEKLAISSTKSLVGPALGASGALEFVAALMAVREGIVPPTIGYLGPDPACDLDYVPNEARSMPVDVALSNSFAFGGLNAVLAIKQYS
jgi:nodulation protein E